MDPKPVEAQQAEDMSAFNLDRQLSPHFKLREFLHNDSLEGVTPEVLTNLQRLAESLEVVRTMCGGRPVSIDSGFRTPAHNAEVGGAPQSQHLLGKAADIQVVGIAPVVVQKILEGWNGGLGSYSSWTHVDIRGHKARWAGP